MKYADNFQNMINMENSNDVQKTTNAGNEVLALVMSCKNYDL